MNIIHIGNFTTGWDSSICDELHISNALNDLGHKTYNIQRETWYTLPNIKPDFILLAQWSGFPLEFTDKLKNLYDCPIVYWCYDYQEQNQEWHCRLIAASDLYLSKRIEDKRFPNWQWLPQDFAPKFLDKISAPVQKDIEVLFTGSYLPWATERNETLKAIDEKFNLVIHSVNAWDGFKDVRPPIMDEGLPELYARAKVILSIDHTLERGYWSDRNAQIMCCGGFVLCRYVPMMESVFRENVAYFYSIEDCLEKLENLLRPDVAYIVNEYAQRGYEYAQKNLKVYNRVNDLLTIVGSIL